jgi:hypothetical protein
MVLFEFTKPLVKKRLPKTFGALVQLHKIGSIPSTLHQTKKSKLFVILALSN